MRRRGWIVSEVIGRTHRHRDGRSAARDDGLDEASAIVQNFQAAFVVIDANVLAAGERDLPDSLASDPRLPGVRLMLAIPAHASDDDLHKLADDAAWSIIRKPFEPAQLASAISETEALARRSRHAGSGV